MKSRFLARILLAWFIGFFLTSPLSTVRAQSPLVPTHAVDLQIFIHKNDKDGSLWDDFQHQIGVTYKKDGNVLNVPIESQLYPWGATIRGTTQINTNARIQEGFSSIKIDSPGTYTVQIQMDTIQSIRKYTDDDPTISNEVLRSYTCKKNDSLPFEPVCETGINISDQDLQLARERQKNLALHLVIIPTGEPEIAVVTGNELIAGQNAEYNEMVTNVGRFALRVQSLLDWTLHISQESFSNTTIERIFSKVLNIVNGFFILILLVIAFMWNMAIIISRRYLKKIMVLFIFSMVFVNFSFPINKLFINITSVLQKSFLVKDVYDENVGKIVKSKITAQDILSIHQGDYGTFVGLSKSDYVAKDYPADTIPSSFPQNEAELKEVFKDKGDLYVNRNQEPIWFNIILVVAGSVGQLLMAIVFLLRIVLLWFFLILSPFLFILILFKFLKQFFTYWSWLYIRWLFVGPLLAISVFITVNIWSIAGVPIESTATTNSNFWFENTTNLLLQAPGVTSGTLNTPREVVKYIVALLMLYMCVLLPFWLTKRFDVFEHAVEQGWKFSKKKTTKHETQNEVKTEEKDMHVLADTVIMSNQSVISEAQKPQEGMIHTETEEWQKNVKEKDVSELTESSAPTKSNTTDMLSNPDFEKYIKTVDTKSLLQDLNISPKDPGRNQRIAEMAADDADTQSPIKRKNSEILMQEMEKRAANNDVQAQQVLTDISVAKEENKASSSPAGDIQNEKTPNRETIQENKIMDMNNLSEQTQDKNENPNMNNFGNSLENQKENEPPSAQPISEIPIITSQESAVVVNNEEQKSNTLSTDTSLNQKNTINIDNDTSLEEIHIQENDEKNEREKRLDQTLEAQEQERQKERVDRGEDIEDKNVVIPKNDGNL